MRRLARVLAWSLASIAALAIVAGALVWWRSESILDRRYAVPPTTVQVPADAAAIAEGRRLAAVYGCTGTCHGKRGEGSLFFDEPIVARLVAPDLSAAVRRYSDAQLVTLIRNGIRPDGRSVFVMPSPGFVHLTDADVGNIVAYLKTLPPLGGPGPGISLGPVGRLGLVTGRFQTAAELIRTAPTPPEARSELGERGRYLARTICTECHGLDLAGGETPAFVAPHLGVVGAYSPEQFVRLMRTGEALGGRRLGIMRIKAQANLSYLTDAEIAALYEYLRGLSAG